MSHRTTAASTKTTYLAAAFGLLLTVSIVRYPEAAFSASVDGLRLWFDIVLPALLPFFAMSDILMGLGVIHGLGVLLEPLMRPVFRIPGVGGFAVAMGLVSGYPLGAKITGQLRREALCTREESERLLSFANTADPLFMVGAVAIGMFGMPQLGLTIAVSHYIAAVLIGFAMRFHANGMMGPAPRPEKGNLLKRALAAMVEARAKQRRPIGELFGDAVRNSVASMLFIGGCIMMFSVFLRILTETGFTQWLALPVGAALGWIGFGPEIVSALIKGIVEITIGAQSSALADAGLLQRCIAASAIIGWSGLSVHAQVAAMVHGTDIRIAPYITARFLHGVCAALLTFVLFEPLGGAAAAMAGAAWVGSFSQVPALVVYWTAMGTGLLAILFTLAVGALLIHAFRRVSVVVFRVKGSRLGPR